MTRDAPQGTQAILRAVRLLKAFSDDASELTLQELSTRAKLSKTTAHRLLAALESEGLLDRGVTRSTYRLGPALVALGMQAHRTNDLRAAVRPFLKVLADETGETATLEVYSDGRMLILDEISPRLVSAMMEVGTQRPLHATSTGKVLLAALPTEMRNTLLPQALKRYTRATITEPQELQKELDEARMVGYAWAVEELEEGFANVAVVLWGPVDQALGSISVGGPVDRIEHLGLSELGMRLKEASSRVSEHMGFKVHTG